jgi:hypothetical protein
VSVRLDHLQYLALTAYSEAQSQFFGFIFVSFLFAFIHGAIAHLVGILPLSIIVTLVMIKTEQFWTVFFIHALNNILALALPTFDLSKWIDESILGVLGITTTLLTIWISIKWLGLPSNQKPYNKKKIWSASLVMVILVAILGILITTMGWTTT